MTRMTDTEFLELARELKPLLEKVDRIERALRMTPVFRKRLDQLREGKDRREIP